MIFSWLTTPIPWEVDSDGLPTWEHDWERDIHDGWSKDLDGNGVCDCGVSCPTETEWVNHTAKRIPFGTRAGQRGAGLVWRLLQEQIERYADGRGDPPPIMDVADTIGRVA